MSAGIVYEGVARGGSGSLFKDVKFWISQKVPQRHTWVHNVESNGGQVVKLEKMADYLIADHAKRDAPSGAYSWKFIADSVQQGKLLDIENYLIGAKPAASSKSANVPRPAGAVAQKGTRTPFTTDDDRILARFVTKHEREGNATSGNEIYKTLEAKYPHHTFQSWRDRWVKKVQHMPRPAVSDGSPSPPPSTAKSTRASGHAPRAVRASQAAPADGDSAASPLRATRARFTEAEDRMLTEYVQNLEREGEPVQGNKIFQTLANDFPQHPWASWRDRWVRHLNPARRQVDDDEEEEEPQLDTPKAKRRTVPSAGATKSESVATPNHRRASGQKPLSNSPILSTNREEAVSPPPDIMPPSPPAQTSDRGAPTEEVGQEAEPEAETEIEQQFYEDYRAFMGDGDVYLRLTIRGNTFKLWDLWRAVASQKVEPEERDWQQISEALGFDWVKLEKVEDEVRECYDEQLADFEKMLLEFEEKVDVDDSAEEEEGLDVSHRAQDVDSEVHFRSSPPVQSPSKRKAEPALPSSRNLFLESPRKRPRLSKDREIPSTPDHVNGTSHLRNPVSAAVSPSDKRLSSLPKSSRTQSGKHSSNARHIPTEEEEAEDQVSDLPKLPNATKRIIEPETQDWRFEPETQHVMFDTQMEDIQDDSQDEVTPSQQLRSESDARYSDPAPSRSAPHGPPVMDPTTPTPKRRVTNPFHTDGSDDEPAFTPKARFGKGINPILSTLSVAKAMRRSLPSTLARKAQAETDQTRPRDGPSRSSPATKAPLMPRSSAAKQASSPAQVPTIQATASLTQAEKLAGIVEWYVSLGYSQKIARRGLEATTWNRGLAGQIMQMLKNGEPMPTNWEGVWTPRDDDGLLLVDSDEPPKDEREAKRRTKESKRILNKHGEEGVELRRKWLATRDEL